MVSTAAKVTAVKLLLSIKAYRSESCVRKRAIMIQQAESLASDLIDLLALENGAGEQNETVGA